jgi:hypothetical protein
MRDARVVRLLCEHLFEDGGRLQFIGVGLVRRQRRRVERERIEDAGFAVLGIFLPEPLHRLLVGDASRAVVDLAPIKIEGSDGVDVIAFPVGLRPDRFRLLDCGRSGLQRGFAGRIPERIPDAHGDPPIGHSATGIRLADGIEGLHRLLVPE